MPSVYIVISYHLTQHNPLVLMKISGGRLRVTFALRMVSLPQTVSLLLRSLPMTLYKAGWCLSRLSMSNTVCPVCVCIKHVGKFK